MLHGAQGSQLKRPRNTLLSRSRSGWPLLPSHITPAKPQALALLQGLADESQPFEQASAQGDFALAHAGTWTATFLVTQTGTISVTQWATFTVLVQGTCLVTHTGTFLVMTVGTIVVTQVGTFLVWVSWTIRVFVLATCFVTAVGTMRVTFVGTIFVTTWLT